jgi:hypothetical protein
MGVIHVSMVETMESFHAVVIVCQVKRKNKSFTNSIIVSLDAILSILKVTFLNQAFLDKSFWLANFLFPPFQKGIIIFFIFLIKVIQKVFCTAVVLIGGTAIGTENVYARNPTNGIYGPVCDDFWDMADVNKFMCNSIK